MATEVTQIGPMVVLEHQLVTTGGAVTERVSVVRDVVVWSAVCGVVRVPATHRCFATDLASVPWFWRWVVGRVGVHLRAAVVHDWLLHRAGHGDTTVSRADADVAFHEIMRRDGVDVVTAWLMLAAVTIATAVAGGHGRVMRLWVPLSMVVVVVAGLWAWVSLGPLWPPLVAAPAAALGLSWPRCRRTGAVALASLAVVWPATLAVVVTGAAVGGTRHIIRWLTRVRRR